MAFASGGLLGGMREPGLRAPRGHNIACIPASERRSLTLSVGVGRAVKVSCTCCTVARFCKNNVSLWAPEPQRAGGVKPDRDGKHSLDLRVFVSAGYVFNDVRYPTG